MRLGTASSCLNTKYVTVCFEQMLSTRLFFKSFQSWVNSILSMFDGFPLLRTLSRTYIGYIRCFSFDYLYDCLAFSVDLSIVYDKRERNS